MAWNKFFVVGLVASGAIAACSTTTNIGIGGDAGPGAGGATSTGGADAGKGTGGATTSTGGTAGTGGTVGTGGKDAGTSCAKDDSPAGDCTTCVATECSAEWAACLCDPACGAGGEYACIQACLIGQVADGGVTPDADACASQCAVKDGGGFVSDVTSSMLACVRGLVPDAGSKNCQTACFGGSVPN